MKFLQVFCLIFLLMIQLLMLEANDALLAEGLLPCAVLGMKQMFYRGFQLSSLRDFFSFCAM